ncbi:hypothetical protein [Corynebacterium caspium]|uniref:hypothetical protein n=1 Tax=Corynebacterium caspium TaxID=234828 RepID=UPI00037B533D|nr:hypothetical protein [Corynebacterium caspium]WKD58512.1 hypothetical protein CCASP_00380 [Corynebacterium caspium DSM 44850]
MYRKDDPRNIHIAALFTNVPLDDFMTRLVAEELPMVDSVSRTQVYEELAAYEGPIITSQEMLPVRVRTLLDL